MGFNSEFKGLIQFDLLRIRYCSKHVHVENYYKCIKICASSWSLAEVMLRCTVSETLKKKKNAVQVCSLGAIGYTI